MTRRELQDDNEKTLSICEQVATGEAMCQLDWLHEDELGAEGPTPRLDEHLEALEATIESHRTAADALDAHLARMKAWVGAGCP